MFKSADILREASRTARITILPAGLRQRTQQTCQSNSLCYPMSHMHTEKNAPHNGLQQTSTVGEFSWSSLWPNKEIHHLQDLWDCTGLPTSFLTGGSCWPSGSCGREALRTIAMGGRHGRHLVTAGTVFVASTWQQIYQVNFVKPKNICHASWLSWSLFGKTRWDLPSLRGAHRLGRGRSSSQFLVQFVIEKKKSTQNNCSECCKTELSQIHHKGPKNLMMSDENLWERWKLVLWRVCDVSGHVC